MKQRGPRIEWHVWALDMAILVVFAAIGRQSHNEANPPLAIIMTAAPFLVTWSLMGALSGVLVRQRLGRWLGLTAISNIVAVLAGLGLRSIILQREIPISFALVALGVTTLMLIGVRLVQFRQIPQEDAHA